MAVIVLLFCAALGVMLFTHAWGVMALLLFIALLVALSVSGYWYIEATHRKQAIEKPLQAALLEHVDQRLSDTKSHMAESRRQLRSAVQDIDNTYDDAKRRMEAQAATFDQRYGLKGE